jgi:hypothetical protein
LYGGSIGRFGEFKPTEAWLGQGPNAPSGPFAIVEETGVRCSSAPCNSFREKKLNSSAAAPLAELGWDEAGVDDAQIGRAITELFVRNVIIAGDRYTVRGPGGSAKARTVTQYYTRARDLKTCYVGGCSGQVCSDQPRHGVDLRVAPGVRVLPGRGLRGAGRGRVRLDRDRGADHLPHQRAAPVSAASVTTSASPRRARRIFGDDGDHRDTSAGRRRGRSAPAPLADVALARPRRQPGVLGQGVALARPPRRPRALAAHRHALRLPARHEVVLAVADQVGAAHPLSASRSIGQLLASW